MTTAADTPAFMFDEGARCLATGCTWATSAPTPEQRGDLIVAHLAEHAAHDADRRHRLGLPVIEPVG